MEVDLKAVAGAAPNLPSNEDVVNWLMLAPKTISLWGDSGDGKTAQVGELAELLYMYGRTPDGRPLRTRLYTADEGGVDTIAHYIELGIIEPIYLYRKPRPWEWMNAATLGKTLKGDQWVTEDHSDIGLWAFEGATSFGEELRKVLVNPSGNLAGMPMQSADKDAHGRSYGQAQDRVGDCIKQSFMLPRLKLWTARARRGEDDANADILGPQVVGKALTSALPAWFTYTFRVTVVPADLVLKTPEIHRLYLGDHQERTMKGLGNSRNPLDGNKLPPCIEPASLTEAFRMILGSRQTATDAVRARAASLGLTLGKG